MTEPKELVRLKQEIERQKQARALGHERVAQLERDLHEKGEEARRLRLERGRDPFGRAPKA